MSENTSRIQSCLDRLRAGDVKAKNELIVVAGERLERLARKMLRDYGRVRRWEDTADVVQNASLRLCRALDNVPLATVRDFFRLAAVQIRRELIDLARHYYGPQGQGAHHASQRDNADGAPLAFESPESTNNPSKLSEWTEFHRQATALPDDEREVFDLLWYQGLLQAEAAAVMGVSERTVKRYWQAARLRLHDALKGDLPKS